MTSWLVNRFVKDADNTEDPRVRGAYGTLASIVCIVCNVVLCLAKGAIGIVSGSVAIVADAVNNLSDASSNIISLVGFKLASRPADAGHPYGHGRYEYIAGLAVAVLILVIGVELVRTSVDKIIHPEAVSFSIALVVVLVFSIAVKLWMAFFNKNLGKRIASTTLYATAADSRNDVITTTAVLLAAVLAEFTGLALDGWAGLGVGLFIVYSGFELVRDTLDPLLGSTPDPELVKHIHDKVMSYEGILGTHDLMIHDYGPGRRFASTHVEMPAEMSPIVSHDIIDNIEADFLENDNLPMVIHYDPIVTDDYVVCDFRQWLADNVKRIDERLSIHDLRLVTGPTHTNVIFDVARPTGFGIPDADLKNRVAAIVKERCPDAVCKITIDDLYFSAE